MKPMINQVYDKQTSVRVYTIRAILCSEGQLLGT
jgi:hypothetical protein